MMEATTPRGNFDGPQKATIVDAVFCRSILTPLDGRGECVKAGAAYALNSPRCSGMYTLMAT